MSVDLRRVTIIGDSHVGGLVPHIAGAAMLSRSGWSAPQFAADWPTENARGRVIVIVLGTNDSGVSDVDEATAMSAIVTSVRRTAPGARIVWVGPPTVTRPDLPGPLARIAAAQAATAVQLGIEWIDGRHLTGSGQRDDGVHFTPAGYEHFAAELARALGMGGAARPLGPSRADVLVLVVAGLVALSTVFAVHGYVRRLRLRAAHP